MPTAEEMLSEPEIKRFLSANQNAAERIRRAAMLLERHADINDVAALRKLLPALATQVINVFFSYKQKDERAARIIVDVLRESSAEKLQITYQAEFLQAIEQAVARDQQGSSKCQLVHSLASRPFRGTGLCLFETGLFEAQLTPADRLICLHHPDTAVPSPIEGYHAVAATLPEVEKFLQMVFVEEDPIFGMPPVNRGVENRIPELARVIVDAIRVPRSRMNRVVFEPWIRDPPRRRLRIPERAKDLDAAAVVSANKEALDLFGLLECKSNFGELRDGIEESAGDGRWRSELFHVVRKISRGRKFFPIQAVFQAHTGRMYRPVALAIDRAGPSGPIQTYHITFAEDVSTADTRAMPKKLAALATLLRFTFRFRWEVLEPFTRGPLTKEDVARLDVCLRRIRVDWQSRGSIGQEDITKLFTGEQGTRVNEMFKLWGRLRNDEGTGDLDIALEQKDGVRIPSVLQPLLAANQDFLEIAADRFSEMIRDG